MTRDRDRPPVAVTLLSAMARGADRVHTSSTVVGRDARYRGAGALPAVIVVGLLAWGLASLVWRAFHAYDSFTDTEGRLSFAEFADLFGGTNSDYYIAVLVRTVLLSLITTVGAIAMAVPVAYTIVRARNNALRMVAIGLCLVPFLMGDIVRAFGWLLLLGRDGAYGWITHIVGGSRETLIGTSLGVVLGSSFSCPRSVG
jgi:putative spermidine/putrescine transport system permease protein